MVEAIAKTNVDKFVFALRAKKAACQHTYPEILNKAALNVAFRASSFTPKGNAALIRSQLTGDANLRFALTAIALKKKGVGILKSPDFAKEVERFVSRRASSAGYLRAAYAKAIEQLGGSFRGSHFKGASDGFANRATVSRLLAEIVTIVAETSASSATSAERIGMTAINEAIAFVADDMLAYAHQKLMVAAAT
jgi:hypothetical protein